jgi:hypothetical protein
MATTTPNFSWPVPTSTDLVKDGATAIEALGDSIDASLVDLKGGTTGQVLSKTSGTDMDFTWVTSDDANAIQNTIVDAKGDLIGATAADTPARLAVGTNGQVLTADSTASTGLAWATPASGGGMTVIASGSIANSATGFSITSIPATYNWLQLVIRNSYSNAADINSRLRVNNLSTGIYAYNQSIAKNASVTTAAASGSANLIIDNFNSSRDANSSVYVVNFWDYAGNAWKSGTVTSFHEDRSTATLELINEVFGIELTSAIDRIDLITGNANTFAGAGTYTLYGVK